MPSHLASGPGSGCQPDLNCLSILSQLNTDWDRGQGSHSGNRGKGGPGGVDEAELAFLELLARLSCCVLLSTLSQTHAGLLPLCWPSTAWFQWPVYHFVEPHPLPTAMFLQKELVCSPLVGIQGDLFVRTLSGALRTLKYQCRSFCFQPVSQASRNALHD